MILINHVKRAACAVYGVSTAELEGRDRRREVSEPRQMAMAVAREITGQSLGQIGRAFSRTDANVVYAVSAVAEGVSASARDQETFLEIARLARGYAEGADPEQRISRGGDVPEAAAARIRELRDQSVSPWIIAQRLGVPMSAVSRALES
jgi:hypothetical protein